MVLQRNLDGWLIAPSATRRTAGRRGFTPLARPGRETLLVQSCRELLHACGCPAWRCGVGSREWTDASGTKRIAQFGVRGLPDLLGIMPPTGRLIAIECKVGDGLLSPDQARVLADFKTAGAFVAVVRDSTLGLADVIRSELEKGRAMWRAYRDTPAA